MFKQFFFKFILERRGNCLSRFVGLRLQHQFKSLCCNTRKCTE